MKKGKSKKERVLLWDMLLKDNIIHQANFVEIMGILGIILIAVSIGFLWIIKIDITIPAEKGEFVKTSSGEYIVQAKVLSSFISSVKEKQKVAMEISLKNDMKVKAFGDIADVDRESGNSHIILTIKPDISKQILAQYAKEYKGIHLRVILEKKRFINLFIDKKDSE